MDRLRIRLMHREAKAFLHDSEILSNRIDRQSDANYLLRLLSFELYLKCLSCVLGIPCGKRHNYKNLFSNLPKYIREEVIEKAQQDYAGHVDYSNLDLFLNTFEDQFVRLRYPYEYYEGLTQKEYTEKAEDWEKQGMPLEQATIRYYPMELRGLIDAIEGILKREIAKQGDISNCSEIQDEL